MIFLYTSVHVTNLPLLGIITLVAPIEKVKKKKNVLNRIADPLYRHWWTEKIGKIMFAVGSYSFSIFLYLGTSISFSNVNNLILKYKALR